MAYPKSFLFFVLIKNTGLPILVLCINSVAMPYWLMKWDWGRPSFQKAILIFIDNLRAHAQDSAIHGLCQEHDCNNHGILADASQCLVVDAEARPSCG